VWVDARGHATTHTLARVAPSDRALDRVHVARAFTTHQHHTLVAQVARWLRGAAAGPFGAPETDRPAVVVCPALDALYLDGDLPDADARALLARAVALLSAAARERGLPVLVTRAHETPDTDLIRRAATTVEVTRTACGPRFAAPDLAFETLVYPVADGVVQTTFAFWRQVLAERHPSVATGRRDDAASAPPGSTRTARPGGR
jgi:hypothetical protein